MYNQRVRVKATDLEWRTRIGAGKPMVYATIPFLEIEVIGLDGKPIAVKLSQAPVVRLASVESEAEGLKRVLGGKFALALAEERHV